ncbi:DUF5335 domain-containing protein [Massilia sp. P8910]|uniref:DUF5335 family protein n=1 Tax=Massilia antarctica TaxID=2765360 RepID=UPI0006BB945C|nr:MULTISPECIES: DUF5335 family protein [Massilia]MCE3606375.1 DUF5335 domain-containing protein [Massilia antarctica]MCY0910368.1 DUF5335 family protein [Massilia sp. H27-R4]CUI09291.1 putative protein [Janthinobacterium sp. CG23_2]CUU33077.1 putative protein [Janthinobacterium sp. CG23_2]
MSTEKLDKSAWHGFFDGISKILPGKQVEIEVNSLRIGAQIEARYAPLMGIVYDERSDILEVVLEDWDHTIAHVREIFVERQGVNLNSVLLIDADGVEQIVRLRDPLMLPASGPA